MLKKITSKLDSHTLEVVKKSSASMVVKVFGMIMGIGISVFLGRILGADGLGVFNLVNKVTSVFFIFVMLGMGDVLVKQIAIGYEHKDWQLVSNTMYSAKVINGTLAIVLTSLGILLAPFIAKSLFSTPQLEVPLKIALIAMIPQVFNRIFSAGLNGFRKIWQSNLVNETLSMYAVGSALIVMHFMKVPINVIKVVSIYAVAKSIVTIVVYFYWKKIFPFKGRAVYVGNKMIKMALPLLLVSSSIFISTNADTLMLGALASTEDVGFYSVAARIALLVSFFLQVSNSAIAPKLAGLFADGKVKEMEKMVQRITLGLIGIAIISLLLFIMLGNSILGLWGEEFKAAYWVLVALGVGQFFNISTGCAGLILVMCGFEKIQGYISFSFVILNLVLNYMLIIKFGALGAAIATAITIAGENITKLIMVKIKTGIFTIPFV